MVTAFNPSKVPLVEKAQQDPQAPWFSTGFTAPFFLQSMVWYPFYLDSVKNSTSSDSDSTTFPTCFSVYSSRVKAVKGPNPNFKSDPFYWAYSELNFWMKS